MRRIDKEHIERRVTCKDCPNHYCLDCNPNGCKECGSKEFYTSHIFNENKEIVYSERDLDTIHGDNDNLYNGGDEPIRIFSNGTTTGQALRINPNAQQRLIQQTISDPISPGQILTNEGQHWGLQNT